MLSNVTVNEHVCSLIFVSLIIIRYESKRVGNLVM
jgi:hypothetical protein